MDSSDHLLGVDGPDDLVDDDERDEQVVFEQLALNSNFDPALLDCWGGEEEEEDNDDDEVNDRIVAANSDATPSIATAPIVNTSQYPNNSEQRGGSRSAVPRGHDFPHHHGTFGSLPPGEEHPSTNRLLNDTNAAARGGLPVFFHTAESTTTTMMKEGAWGDALHPTQNTVVVAPASGASNRKLRGPLPPPPPLPSSAALVATGPTKPKAHSKSNSSEARQQNNTSNAAEVSRALSSFETSASAVGFPNSCTATNNIHQMNQQQETSTLPLYSSTLPRFLAAPPGTTAINSASQMQPSSLVANQPLPTLGNSSGSGAAQSSTAVTMDTSMLLPLAFNALAAGVDLSSFFTTPGDATTAMVAAAPGGETVSGNQVLFQGSAMMDSVVEVATHVAAVSIPETASTSLASKETEALASAATTGTATSKSIQNQNQHHESTKRAASAVSKNGKKRSAGGNSRKSKSGGTRGGAQRQPKHGKRNANKNNSSEEEPPFMLFDAPVELRHNFIQSQRALGLPELNDNNSFHFARSNAAATPTEIGGANHQAAAAAAVSSLSWLAGRPLPRLVDARHGDETAGNKRIKNAKEQKRAQRITELIEQLRIRMEKGGWKVGIKSKLHTLSSCSDYVKHLVQTTKDKESAVDQAKRDLETKQRKLEEEKSAQQDPSEPESTTSSLTVSSSSRSAKNHKSKGNSQQQHHSSGDQADKKEPPNTSSAEDSQPNSENNKKHNYSNNNQETNSEDYSSSMDHGDCAKKQRTDDGVGSHVFVGGYKSSVSDITDHNKYAKGSSTGSDERTMTAAPKAAATANNVNDKPAASAPNKPTTGLSTQNTVCSDAAVAETSDPKCSTSQDDSTGKCEEPETPSRMAIQTITTTTTSSNSSHRKRKQQPEESRSTNTVGVQNKKCKTSQRRETTSLERNFELDFQEVFLKSNVPQLIATTTGRILSHNDMFLRVTRLRRNNVERMTIFSLVQPTMLSNLFELVASSLREDDNEQRQQQSLEVENEPQNHQSNNEETTDKKSSVRKAIPLQDYSTMTLPCVTFSDRPTLFMTITLMKDQDVKKRCFHCVFTDRVPPTARGAVGSVTPQLLENLFQVKPFQYGSSSSSSNSGAAGEESNNGSGSSESNTPNSSIRTESDSKEESHQVSSEKTSTTNRTSAPQQEKDNGKVLTSDDGKCTNTLQHS